MFRLYDQMNPDSFHSLVSWKNVMIFSNASRWWDHAEFWVLSPNFTSNKSMTWCVFISSLSRLDNSLVSLVTQWSLLDDDDVTQAIIAMTTHPHPISDITNTFHHYFWQNYTKEQSLILNDGSIIKYSFRNKVRWISVAWRVFYQVST